MNPTSRYTSVAISLHWLIAFFIIALLVMGKFMTYLEDDDPMRYTLTQLHKSFGITVLLLMVFRIFWRLTHKPPALPHSATGFEKVVSTLAHSMLYLLMVVIPVSGWAMVSASPMKLETFLYGVVPWPHIPFLASLPDDSSVAERSALLHTWLGNALLALVLLHTAAALYHQWFRRDQLISRMMVSDSHRSTGDLNHGLVVGVLLAIAGSIFLAGSLNNSVSSAKVAPSEGIPAVAVAVAAVGDNSHVLVSSSAGFTAMQSGEPITGKFGDVQIALAIDKQNPQSSSLTATVMTGSVATDDFQIQSTMVTADWFASEEFPQATFEATGFEQLGDSVYAVTGDLTIRDKTQSVEFELLLEDKTGRGEFTINRSDFGVGTAGQDEFVEPEVVIRFEVQDEG